MSFHVEEPLCYVETRNSTGQPAKHADEILDIVKRNYRGLDNIRPVWMRLHDQDHRADFALVRGCINDGDAFKIPFGWLTEATLYYTNGKGVHRRGWRPLLKSMFVVGWLNPTSEVEDLLGGDVVYNLKRQTGIGVCY